MTWYSKIETHLNTGMGLYLYHITRSQKLKNFLSDLSIGINYQNVTEIKKNIAETVLQKQTESDVVFIPTSLKEDQPVYFAIDNVDLNIDTPDGKKSCCYVFVTVPNEVLQAFINLGSSGTPSVADVKPLEVFVIQLYCRHKIKG